MNFTKITDALKKYATLAEAGKALNICPAQLKRWVDCDALVDNDGQVWIRTIGIIKDHNVWPIGRIDNAKNI